MTRCLAQLWKDEHGFILSAELVLISTILVLGMIVGLTSLQSSVVGELTDVSGAIRSLNQSYFYKGYSGRIPGQAHYLLNINIARPMPRSSGFFGGGSVSFTGASDIGSNIDTQGREHAYVSVDAFVGQVISGLGYWRLGLSNLTNARKNRERVDADSAGGLRTERSVERYQTRVFLSVGTRW